MDATVRRATVRRSPAARWAGPAPHAADIGHAAVPGPRPAVRPSGAVRFAPLWRALPWVTLLALWYGLRGSGLVSPGLLPLPQEVAAAAWAQMSDGTLAVHWAASAARVVAGVVIGTGLAIPVGFALGRFAPLRLALDPLINSFRALPPIALIPLVIVYLGIGETAKVWVLSFSAFFAAVIVISEGMAQIPPLYVHVARTLGASPREVFVKLVLPLALPHVLTALRVALGVTWATLVAAELVAAQAGLGAMIQVAASFFQLDIIYVGIILIGATALAMDHGLRRLSRRLLAWQERLPS